MQLIEELNSSKHFSFVLWMPATNDFATEARDQNQYQALEDGKKILGMPAEGHQAIYLAGKEILPTPGEHI